MDHTSKEARGCRLKKLRDLTAPVGGRPLTRATLARKHSINPHTLKNWEVGHATGLTENGAKQMIDVYQKEYIDCSVRWLLTGEGPEPKRREILASEIPYASYSEHQTNLFETQEKEIETFMGLNPEGITFVVNNDVMMPAYLPGDTVGGLRHYMKDFPQLIDKDCIVETRDGNTWLRRIQNSTVPGRYNLYASNPSSKVELPTIYSVEIVSAAPVMRIWRGKKWLS